LQVYGSDSDVVPGEGPAAPAFHEKRLRARPLSRLAHFVRSAPSPRCAGRGENSAGRLLQLLLSRLRERATNAKQQHVPSPAFGRGWRGRSEATHAPGEGNLQVYGNDSDVVPGESTAAPAFHEMRLRAHAPSPASLTSFARHPLPAARGEGKRASSGERGQGHRAGQGKH